MSLPAAATAASRENPARQHSEPAQHGPLLGGEQAQAPVDGGLHRALPIRDVALAAAHRAAAVVEAGDEIVDPQHRGLSGGELQRQGQTVEPAAQLDHRGDVVVGQREPCVRPVSALDEQLHGRNSDRGVDGCDRRRERKGVDAEHLLAGDAERFSARRDDPDAGSGRQQLGDEARRPVGNVLAVVDHDQRPFQVEMFDGGFPSVATVDGDAECRGDRRPDQPRVVQR